MARPGGHPPFRPLRPRGEASAGLPPPPEPPSPPGPLQPRRTGSVAGGGAPWSPVACAAFRGRPPVHPVSVAASSPGRSSLLLRELLTERGQGSGQQRARRPGRTPERLPRLGNRQVLVVAEYHGRALPVREPDEGSPHRLSVVRVVVRT